MAQHDSRGTSWSRQAWFAAVLLVLGGIVALVPLIITSRSSTPLRTFAPQSQNTFTITLENDSAYNAEVDYFVATDFTATHTIIGSLDSGDSTTVTLPSNVDTSYVFSMTIANGTDTGVWDSAVTEARLEELNYDYRLFQDDMGMASLEPGAWPTDQYTPTPWDLSSLPTSTYPPTDP